MLASWPLLRHLWSDFYANGIIGANIYLKKCLAHAIKVFLSCYWLELWKLQNNVLWEDIYIIGILCWQFGKEQAAELLGGAVGTAAVTAREGRADMICDYGKQ